MKLPVSTRNWLTISGFALAVITLFFILLLFIFSTIFDKGSSYIGLFIYVVLPVIMVTGLILIPIGMLYKRRQIKKRGILPDKPLPYIDLNDKRHRNAFKIFIIGTIVFLFLSSIGSYEAYHYSESVEFCGTLCHKVMEPEHTAFQNSAHSRLLCVDCHVGPGTDWYVRSKLSGLYQVYSVLFHKYPTPIETPLHNLRPARETCERCHWPQKFYPRNLRTQKTFLTDSASSEWDIILQMKLGPEYSALGLQEGIHWHINPDVKVEYVSEKDNRENIVWVKYTDLKTGKAYIYENEEAPAEDSIMKGTKPRTMDCIDCHNRPSHNYRSPPDYVDNLLISGKLQRDIPAIKAAAMEVLKLPFGTKDSAMTAIMEGGITYYKDNYPDYYAANTKKVTAALTTLQDAYSKNAFPEMKVTYDAYPDHIGHLESMGCFRCHNDLFKSKDNRVISKDCNLCHTIIGQGKPGQMVMASVRDTLEFEHPVKLRNDAWKTGYCSECHKVLYE